MVNPSINWIRLNRCLLSNSMWLEEPFTRGQAWVDLLLSANYSTGTIRRRGIRVVIRRGEVGTSLREFSARWKWSLGKVQRFFDELKNDTQIHYRMDTENVSVTSVICITNYEKYQSGDTETDTEIDTETDTETSTRRVQNKKVKKEKNKPLSEFDREKVDFFEALWKAYPRKIGKEDAMRHYLKTVKTEADLDRINAALGSYLLDIENTEMKYIKHGSAWFRQWQDWERTDEG